MNSSAIQRGIQVLIAGVILSVTSQASDWTQFRGPNGNGMAEASAVPIDFSKSRTVWSTPVSGSGWSSPVVSNGVIWITAADVEKATPEQIAAKREGVQFAQIKTVAGSVRLRAIAFNAESGQVLHDVTLRNVTDPDLINPLNSYASPTPAIQGEKVVCHFGSYGTWCLNAKTGERVWDTALVIDHSVGPGSSPVIVDGVVLIVCDGIDRQFVAGLDLESGQQVWKTDRPPIRSDNGEFRKAYSTPLLIEVDGATQAVIPGAQWMCSYDPASGKEIWRADCGSGFSTTPMPVWQDGLVICSTGFMTPELVAIDPAGKGDITESNIVWKNKQGGSTMPTAVASNGLLYSVSDKGILTVLKTADGEIVVRERIGGKFAASPLLVNNSLYLGSQEGIMTVLDVQTLKRVARNSMDSPLMASPAVIGSDLVIRTGKTLSRIAAR